MKTLLLFLAIIALIFSLKIFAVEGELQDGKYVVHISKEQIEEAIEQALPIEETKMGVDMEVNAVSVDFSNSGKITVDAKYSTSGYGVNSHGNAIIRSLLKYDSGDFYLYELEVVDFTQDFEDEDTVSSLKKAADGMFKKFVSKVTVDGDDDSKQAFNELREHYVPLIKESISNGLKRKISTTPVYSLNGKGVKEDVAAMALEEVTVSASGLTVYLSFSGIVFGVMIWVVSALLAFCLVLIMFIRK